MDIGASVSKKTAADFKIKVCCVGEKQSGKSALLRAANGYETKLYKESIGVDFATVNLTSSGKNVTVEAWDISGGERFGHMCGVYFRYSKAIIVLLNNESDISVNENSLTQWVNEAKTKCEEAKLFVILTHSDAAVKKSSLAAITSLVATHEGVTFLGEYNATNQVDSLKVLQTVTDAVMSVELLPLLLAQIRSTSEEYGKTSGGTVAGKQFAQDLVYNYDHHTGLPGVDRRVVAEIVFLMMSVYLSNLLNEKPDTFFQEIKKYYVELYQAINRWYPDVIPSCIAQGNFPRDAQLCQLLGVAAPQQEPPLVELLTRAMVQRLYTCNTAKNYSDAAATAICDLYGIPMQGIRVYLFNCESRIRAKILACQTPQDLQRHVEVLLDNKLISGDGFRDSPLKKTLLSILEDVKKQLEAQRVAVKTVAEWRAEIVELAENISGFSNYSSARFAADVRTPNIPIENVVKFLLVYLSNPCGENPDKFFLEMKAIAPLLLAKLREEFTATFTSLKAAGYIPTQSEDWVMLEKATTTTLEEDEFACGAKLFTKALVSCLYRDDPTASQAICKRYEIQETPGIAVRMNLFNIETQIKANVASLKRLSSLQFHIESLLQQEAFTSDSTLKKALRGLLENCRRSIADIANLAPPAEMKTFKVICLGQPGVGKTTFRRGITPDADEIDDANNQISLVSLGKRVELHLSETEKVEKDAAAFCIVLDMANTLEENERQFAEYSRAINQLAVHGPIFVILSKKEGLFNTGKEDIEKRLQNVAMIDEFNIPKRPHWNVLLAKFVQDLVDHVHGLQRWNQLVLATPDDVVAQIQLKATAYLNWCQGAFNFPTVALKTLAEDIQRIIHSTPDEHLRAKHIFNLMSYHFCHLDSKGPGKFGEELYPLYLKLMLSLFHHAPHYIAGSIKEGSFPRNSDLCYSLPSDGIFVLEREPYVLIKPSVVEVLRNYLPIAEQLYQTELQLSAAQPEEQSIATLLTACLLKHSRTCEFPANRPDDKAVRQSQKIISQIVAFFDPDGYILDNNYTGVSIRSLLPRCETCILKKCLELSQDSKFTLSAFSAIEEPDLQSALKKVFGSMPQRMAPLPEYGD